MSWHPVSILSQMALLPALPRPDVTLLGSVSRWRLQSCGFAMVPATFSAGVFLQKRPLPPLLFFKYSQFSLVMLCRVTVIDEPLLLEEITGLGSCEPVVTFLSTDQYITLFYVCFCWKAFNRCCWFVSIDLIGTITRLNEAFLTRSLQGTSPPSCPRSTHSIAALRESHIKQPDHQQKPQKCQKIVAVNRPQKGRLLSAFRIRAKTRRGRCLVQPPLETWVGRRSRFPALCSVHSENDWGYWFWGGR